MSVILCLRCVCEREDADVGMQRFYFASQVTDAGDSVQYEHLSGEAHGKAYWELVQLSRQGEWQVNFGSDGERHEKVI